MASKQNLMAVGMPGAQANLLGVDQVQVVAAAGTTQAGAAQLPGNFVRVNGPDGAGVILPRSGTAPAQILYNIEAVSNYQVYPAPGETLLPNNAPNLPVTLAASRTLIAIPADSPNAPAWAVFRSA